MQDQVGSFQLSPFPSTMGNPPSPIRLPSLAETLHNFGTSSSSSNSSSPQIPTSNITLDSAAAPPGSSCSSSIFAYGTPSLFDIAAESEKAFNQVRRSFSSDFQTPFRAWQPPRSKSLSACEVPKFAVKTLGTENTSPTLESSPSRRRKREEDESEEKNQKIIPKKARKASNVPTPVNGDAKMNHNESERMRRDRLRVGFEKLRRILPVDNPKMSKVMILENSCEYIQKLEEVCKALMQENVLYQQQQQQGSGRPVPIFQSGMTRLSSSSNFPFNVNRQ